MCVCVCYDRMRAMRTNGEEAGDLIIKLFVACQSITGKPLVSPKTHSVRMLTNVTQTYAQANGSREYVQDTRTHTHTKTIKICHTC